MRIQNKISRKTFFRGLSTLAVGFGIWLWYKITKFQSFRDKKIEFRHPDDIPKGISYFGSYYLIRTDIQVRAFSTTCTHAGCRIGRGTNEIMQCGCHGSQFNAQSGQPLKGPALKPLQELECQLDRGEWVVRFVT